MINFKWYSFSQLSLMQLYEILATRASVFVVEQACPYLDPDGKDIAAFHLIGTVNKSLVAYLRLIPPDETKDYLIFGRIITAKSARKNGYGKKLMEELISYCDNHYPGVAIKCSAQYYLKNFYESFGFTAFGDIYNEDDIPHIAMQKI